MAQHVVVLKKLASQTSEASTDREHGPHERGSALRTAVELEFDRAWRQCLADRRHYARLARFVIEELGAGAERSRPPATSGFWPKLTARNRV